MIQNMKEHDYIPTYPLPRHSKKERVGKVEASGGLLNLANNNTIFGTNML